MMMVVGPLGFFGVLESLWIKFLLCAAIIIRDLGARVNTLDFWSLKVIAEEFLWPGGAHWSAGKGRYH